MSQPTILYRLFDVDGTLLYVGITGSLGQRWEQHVATKHWWDQVTRTEIERFPDRDLAAAAEKVAITTERPIYNLVRPLQQRPSVGVNYRYSEEEHQLWKIAAIQQGQSFKEWIRRSLNEAAQSGRNREAS